MGEELKREGEISMERPFEAIPYKRILTDYKLEEMLWSERSLRDLKI